MPRRSQASSSRFMKRARPTSNSTRDRKSTRLNSSHSQISYAVFCLKKKLRQSTHGAHDERARRCGHLRAAAAGDHDGPGWRQAHRHDVSHRERAADGSRGARTSRVRADATLRKRLSDAEREAAAVQRLTSACAGLYNRDLVASSGRKVMRKLLARRLPPWMPMLIATALGMVAVHARAELTEITVAQQYGISYLPLMLMEEQKLIEKHARANGIPDLKVG